MIKKMFIGITFCIMSFGGYAATSCLEQMKQIHSDMNKYKESLPDQKLAWLTEHWLKTNFTAGSTHTIKKQMYEWRNFSYLKGEDGTSVAMGPLPKGLTSNSSFNEIIKISRVPKKIQTETLYQSEWHCEEDNNLSTLSFLK